MTNVISLILSIILHLWPVKFRVQKVKRLRLGSEMGGLHIGQSVEYALWLPFFGWSSIWAVFRGAYAIPRWRVTGFQRKSGHGGMDEYQKPRHTQWARKSTIQEFGDPNRDSHGGGSPSSQKNC